MMQHREAEQAVLGSLLLDGSLLEESRLGPDHFTDPAHRLLFQHMREVEVLDFTTLAAQLGEELLGQLGGLSYLLQLIDCVPNTENFSHYEKLVHQAWKLRQAKRIVEATDKRLQGMDEKAIASAIEALSQLDAEAAAAEPDVKQSLINLYTKWQEHKGPLTGITSGYKALDRVTYGLQRGELAIIGARPSIGKTAFALNIARHAAEAGAIVVVFSLEMVEDSLLARLVGITGGVSLSRLGNPSEFCQEDDWERIARAMGCIGGWPLHLYDTGIAAVRDIRACLRRLRRRYGDRDMLVVVDYLQLLDGSARYQGDRRQEMSEISRHLKKLAQELNVAMIAISQLSRAVESRQDKRPMLSDLRETGQIEQDADLILLLYREGYYNRDVQNSAELTEIEVAKNRNGPVGRLQLLFLKEYGLFLEARK